MKQRLINAILTIRAYLPESLPDSTDALEAFTDEIIRIGGFPSNDSFKNAVATQMLHLDINRLKASKISFVRAIKRGITNETAYAKIQEIKAKAAKKATDATAV